MSSEIELDLMQNAIPYLNHEITLEELDDVLSLTIFEDKEVKTILFLICLLTFTEKEQKHIILTGESSIGKTYNISEVLWFFPEKTVLRFEGATPKSFIHKKNAVLIDVRNQKPIDLLLRPQKGDPKENWDTWYEVLRNSGYLLDYSNKIIVFPDMPNTKLLKSLRPILSHDRKVCKYNVTEKTKSGLRTKEVLIKGFFTSVFACVSTFLDEQETTRHYLLSPSDSKTKIDKSLDLISRKNSDPNFVNWYNTEPKRFNLKMRVEDIKAEGIKQIFIPEGLTENLRLWFRSQTRNFCPKTQRDFPRLIGLVKAWALLNYKNRNRKDDVLWCNLDDVETAKQLYEPILTCNELGLTPEEYTVWELIQPFCDVGLSIREIHDLYYKTKKRNCSDYRLRGMLKNFCRSGLLREEKEANKIKYYLIKHEGKQRKLEEIK